MNEPKPLWWEEAVNAPRDHLMRHPFSGDPWGPCAKCQHPAYHEIHRVEDDEGRGG